jgi:hypothetical protein
LTFGSHSWDGITNLTLDISLEAIINHLKKKKLPKYAIYIYIKTILFEGGDGHGHSRPSLESVLVSATKK